MKNLKTVLHVYRFDITKAAEKTAYNDLCTHLKGLGLTKFDVISTDSNFHRNNILPLNDGIIELETKFLFDNQWNTQALKAPRGHDTGLRLFDWHEDIFPNKNIKQGYWLHPTAEMAAIRTDTYVCGYCGKHYYKPGQDFCSSCLDSEYLSEEMLGGFILIACS